MNRWREKYNQQPASLEHTQVQAGALGPPKALYKFKLLLLLISCHSFHPPPTLAWLEVVSSGLLKCLICSDVFTLGPLSQERVHIDPVFINRMMAKTVKWLNDRVTKLGKCQWHLQCMEIVKIL